MTTDALSFSFHFADESGPDPEKSSFPSVTADSPAIEAVSDPRAKKNADSLVSFDFENGLTLPTESLSMDVSPNSSVSREESSLFEFADSATGATADSQADTSFLEETAEKEEDTTGEIRLIKTPPHRPVVAILGVSGLGKNHARWFAKHGCQVVGFLGQDKASLAETAANLHADFGFEGQVYSDLETLLSQVKPEIICVSTPPEFHFAHTVAALEAGAHVLCEKPLVYAPKRKARENLDGAKELVKVAKKNKLIFGTQLQYGAATPILCTLAGLTPSEVGDFAMEIETTNLSAPHTPHNLWLELGPHPISVAQFLAGDGAALISDSLQFSTRTQGEILEANARFSVRRPDGRMIAVRAITRYVPREQIARDPHRKFSFNGRLVVYVGKRLRTGQYIAQYTAPDGYDNIYPDPVDYLVGNFVRAVKQANEPLITGDFGRQNLDWLLQIAG